MLSDQEVRAAFALMGFGTAILVVAALRPGWLWFIPGNYWFGGLYSAGRFGSVVGGVTCIWAGIRELGVVPKPWLGPLMFVWAVIVVWAAIHDFRHRAEIEGY